MKIVSLVQGSSDWHAWRRGGMGASDACHLLGKAPWNSPEKLAAEKRTGKSTDMNAAMARGHTLEPEARVLFQSLTGLRCRPACVHHDQHEWLKASLDGLTEDNLDVVEIKCPRAYKGHELALAGSPPDYYLPQLQHQQLVTGCRRVLYVSYHPSFKGSDRMAIQEVLPDQDYMTALYDAEVVFWRSLGNKV